VPRERNLLLKSLSAADFSLIEPHLRPLEFKQHKVLFEAGQSVSTVYFLYNAIVSLVVTLSTGESIEAAMVGRRPADRMVCASIRGADARQYQRTPTR